MPTSVGSEQSRTAWAPPATTPLDEAAWQAWVARGRASDRRGSDARIRVVKWASIIGLLAAAGLWSHIAPFETVIRFLVTAGALVVISQAFQSRGYAVATVFGGLALLYNPVLPAFSLAGDWQRAVVAASAVPFLVLLAWSHPRWKAMPGFPRTNSTFIVVASFLALGAMPAVSLAGDLSKYRKFQLGTDLSTVARQVGVVPSDAKVIHQRPALIQELQWRPQPVGPSSRTEPVKEVVFSFYDGKLARIVVDYDRYETEGLTADDLIEAISATYGTAAKPNAPAKHAPRSYGDREEVLAQWQDSEYRFELIRSSYGPGFRLVGIAMKLEAPAQAAALEAKRLDDQEAPQRDAARLAADEEAVKAELEKARLANKPRFRL